MSPTKLVGTIIGAIFTIWYTYARILDIPEKKLRLALLPLVFVGGLWVGSGYGFSDQKFTYVDEEMSEVIRGYPFALERHARWYDGSSEDDVSPFPFGVRIMNFAYGLMVFHLFSTIILFLIPVHEVTFANIKEQIEKAKKKKAPEKNGDGEGPPPPSESEEPDKPPKDPPA